jgi:hypothetical protein
MAKMPTFTASAGEVRHALITALEILRPDPANPLTSMVVLYVQSGQLIIHAQHDGFVLHVPLEGTAQGTPSVAVDGVRLSKLLASLRGEERLIIGRSEDGSVIAQTTNLNVASPRIGPMASQRPWTRPRPRPPGPSWQASCGSCSTSQRRAMGDDRSKSLFGGVLLHITDGLLRSDASSQACGTARHWSPGAAHRP